MTIKTVVVYTCDRCWAETEDPEGWLLRGFGDDYCENCRDKGQSQRSPGVA